MTISIHTVESDKAKLLGAIVTAVSILVTLTMVLALVSMGLTEGIVVSGFALWLTWFLLRDGLPPNKMLISQTDLKIGLRNVLATRWFSIEEVDVISDGGQYLTNLDARKLIVAESTAAKVQRMIESRVSEKLFKLETSEGPK